MAPDRARNPDRVDILLDTNAFLMVSQFRFDLLEELRWLVGAYNPLVPDIVIQELSGLAMQKGSDAASARFGLKIAKMRCEEVKTEREEGSADDRILWFAKQNGCQVVTNDRNLRGRLLDEGISVISLVGRQKLEIMRR